MEEYHFWADVLNKFSQLTPWVQAVLAASVCGSLYGCVYCCKEIVLAIAGASHKKAAR